MNLTTKRNFCFAIALVLILGAGLVHGLWADRWESSQSLEEAMARMDNVPMEFGDWAGHDLPPDVESFEQAGARRYLMRSYTNKRTHASFLVILMCGRSGRMAVHTPEVCYQGAGYEMMGRPKADTVKTEVGDELGMFWTARFDKGGMSDLRLYWAWGVHGPWQAPAEPRWQFRGEPHLYKLYVSHDSPAPGVVDAAGHDFLRRFLPELQKALF